MAVRKLEIGTLFSVPLSSEDEFAYGYIVYHDGFIYSNIYNIIGRDQTVPENIENCSVRIRDLMHDYSQFLPRMKKFGRGFFWIRSKMKVKNPLPPKSKYVLHGDVAGSYKIYDICEKIYVQESVVSGDINSIPRQIIRDPSYYPKYIEAEIKDRRLYFDKEIGSYIIADNCHKEQ